MATSGVTISTMTINDTNTFNDTPTFNDTNTIHVTDPRATFAQAVTTARATVQGVRADQLDLPTPCAQKNVRSMLGHMLMVFGRITALGNGDDPMAMADEVTGIADDAWPAAFLQAAHEVQAAWTDSAKLQQTMVLPWATAPGSAMLDMYTAELTVHTWDLAVATGQSVEWNQHTLQVALESALRALPSGDREAYFASMTADFGPDIAIHPPFRNAVDPGTGASTLDQLIGWYGRQPALSEA